MNVWDKVFKNGNYLFTEPEWCVRRFAELAKIRNLNRILDLGCGAGRHVVFLAKHGFETHGLDISIEALKICQSRLKNEGIEPLLVQANMSDLPYPNGFFDGVIAIAAVYHLKLAELKQTIDEIHRILKPGGLLLIEFKSKQSHSYGFGVEIEKDTFVQVEGVETGIPHHYSDRPEIETLMSKFNIFEINHLERISEGIYRSSKWEVWAEK